MDATPAGTSAGNVRRLANGGLILVCIVILGGAVWTIISRGGGPPLGSNSSPTVEEQPRSSARPVFAPRHPTMDDNGGRIVWRRYFGPLVKDRLSLEHIAECYHHAGYRGIEQIEKRLAEGDLALDQRLNALMDIALLYLYEGEPVKASEVFRQIRDDVEKEPGLQKELPSLIFLEGMAALRLGENENCVECQCETSCIFPILPSAVHQKREGSRQAVGYFTEYLKYFPDDTGARWLLNLAYMTLGEYPEKMPAQYRLPLAPFESKADIGRFTDIAPVLGLNQLNLAGGAIMDDFDNDGLLDLVVTSMDPGKPLAFYRNRGDGTFEERSKAAGLAKQIGGLYCVQTDYNNDGLLDIYVCRGAWTGIPQKHSLLRNNGDGTFTDVTKEAGLLTPIDGQVAVWADYDNDGWLDVFVGCETGPCRLYHNRGDGTFEDVTRRAGIDNGTLGCKGANWGDFNGDRYPDLYISNMAGPPRLYRNNRDGTFTDVAKEMGIHQPDQGFSCWFFDYDNDGWPDIFASSFERSLSDVINSHLRQPHSGTTCRLYRNKAGKGFEDVTAVVGLDFAIPVMGSNFADLDNDGYLDIYLGTGTPAYSLLVPNRMFKNVQGKRFVDITTSSGTGHLQKGHAVACGDWDRDGNLDLFEQLGGAAPGDAFRNVLFQNPGKHGNHWISIKLVGKKSNRAAIGARIKLTLPDNDPANIYRYVTNGSSFGGSPLQQHIGIGKATKIDTLEIYWPTSDTKQVFRNLAVDQAIEITEFETKYRKLNYTQLPAPKKNGAAVAGQ